MLVRFQPRVQLEQSNRDNVKKSEFALFYVVLINENFVIILEESFSLFGYDCQLEYCTNKLQQKLDLLDRL